MFLILGLVGHEVTGPARARRGGFGVKKKKLFNKRARFRFPGQTRALGPGMKKLGLLPFLSRLQGITFLGIWMPRVIWIPLYQMPHYNVCM